MYISFVAVLLTANYPESVVDNLPKDMPLGVYYGWGSVDDGEVYKMVLSVGWNLYYKNTKKSMVSPYKNTKKSLLNPSKKLARTPRKVHCYSIQKLWKSPFQLGLTSYKNTKTEKVHGMSTKDVSSKTIQKCKKKKIFIVSPKVHQRTPQAHGKFIQENQKVHSRCIHRNNMYKINGVHGCIMKTHVHWFAYVLNEI